MAADADQEALDAAAMAADTAKQEALDAAAMAADTAKQEALDALADAKMAADAANQVHLMPLRMRRWQLMRTLPRCT